MIKGECRVCHLRLSECGHPADLTDLLGAERAVRKLLWRLKRLGIAPEKVFVHGKETEFVLEKLACEPDAEARLAKAKKR